MRKLLALALIALALAGGVAFVSVEHSNPRRSVRWRGLQLKPPPIGAPKMRKLLALALIALALAGGVAFVSLESRPPPQRAAPATAAAETSPSRSSLHAQAARPRPDRAGSRRRRRRLQLRTTLPRRSVQHRQRQLLKPPPHSFGSLDMRKLLALALIALALAGGVAVYSLSNPPPPQRATTATARAADCGPPIPARASSGRDSRKLQYGTCMEYPAHCEHA